MLNVTFLPKAWDDYLYRHWKARAAKREFVWVVKSKIDDSNQVIYRIEDILLLIAECKSHYGER